LNRNELKDLLPGLRKTNSENYYITNFLMDAWALLSVIGQISVKKYDFEYNNLKDLYESLIFSLDKNKLLLCLKIIKAVKYFREHNTPVNKYVVNSIFLRCDDFMYVNIYFRAGIITGKLSMYHDFLRVGAFGYSPAMDLIKYLQELSSNLKNESIIDLGSGNGLPVCLFSQIIDNVTGVELNKLLVDESLDIIKNLSEKKRINEGSIKIINDDFFNIDLSPYSLIYICWPFDNQEKKEFEEEMRVNLSIKLIAEAKKGTKIIVFIPGMDEKDIFPRLKKISNIKQKYSTQFCFYSVP
jgi:hypothetical protein